MWKRKFRELVFAITGMTSAPLRKILVKIPGVHRLAARMRWNAFIKPGDTVVQAGVDMGAKLGRGLTPNAIIMADIVGPAGKVIAIEPSNDNIQALKEYIRSHNIGNILVVERALWDAQATMAFSLGNESWHSRLAVIESKHDQSDLFSASYEVQADTLDNILADLEIARVNHVCLTINWAEYPALKGMSKVLQQEALTMLIVGGASQSFRSESGDIPIDKQIQNHLEAHGFRVSLDRIGWLNARKP